MWNSLGSLRERVREHAKSAAQVAQGVLQAAAAEEDDPSEPQPEREDDKGWGSWGQQDQQPKPTPAQIHDLPQNAPLPRDDPPAPPPEDDALAPPPEDSFISAKPPVLTPAPRNRPSRYVVTGVSTSQSNPTPPVFPKPSFFAPKPPIISSQPADSADATDGEQDKSEATSGTQADSSHPAVEPPRDSETNLLAQPDHLSASAEDQVPNPAVSEARADTASVPEPAKAEEVVFSEQHTPALADDTFANWAVSAEPNGHSTAPPPTDDNFPGGGLEAAAKEYQPEIVPPPPVNNCADWKVPEAAVQDQEKTPSVDDNFAGWDIPEPAVEPALEQQKSQSTGADAVTDSFAGWNVPETSVEQQVTEDTTEIPAEDSFAGWSVPEAAAGAQERQSTEAPPAQGSFAGWSVPEATVEAQKSQGAEAAAAEDSFAGLSFPDAVEAAAGAQEGQSTEAPPAQGSFAGWSVPEAAVEEQKSQSASAATAQAEDSFANWSVPGAVEAQKRQNKETTPAGDSFANWSVPEAAVEAHKSQSAATAQAEDTFANWSVPETAVEEQKIQSAATAPAEDSFANRSIPEAAVEEQKSQSASTVPAEDSFAASWSVPETAVEEDKSQGATPASTDDNTVAGWSVSEASTGQQQNNQNGWDISASTAQPNEIRNYDNAEKDNTFADWGDANGEWNFGGGGSEVRDAADAADWFSNVAASSVAQETADSATKEAETADEEPSEQHRATEATRPEEDYEPSMPPQMSTPTVSEELTSEKETKEEYGAKAALIPHPDSGNAGDTDHAEKEGKEDENHKLENSSRIPDVALRQENDVWSFDATVPAAENKIDAISSPADDREWNFESAAPVDNSQEPVSGNPIVSSGTVPPAESWLPDHGVQDTETKSPGYNVSQFEVQHEEVIYKARSTSLPEEEPFIMQPSEMTSQLSELQEQIRTLMLERDSAIAAKEESEREKGDLKRSIALIEGDLVQSREESEYLSTERDTLQKERDAAFEQNRQVENERDVALERKLEAEKERDEAVQRGGQGLREARNAIETMRSHQDSTEKREAVITEQIEALRTDLDRISQERNTLLGEAEDLRVALRDLESQSHQKEDELRQRLQIAEHECEIARLEREKALETNELHMDENGKLKDAEKGRAAALAASESRIVELEDYIGSMQVDREDENMRIDLFSKQIEEMKDRTQGVIDERNGLYDEKRTLENQIEEYRQREESYTRDLQDAKREAASLASERDEAKQRFMSMKDQQKELAKRVETIAGERDQLVHARTASTASSSSVSEKEKALAVECEQKTRAVVILQKKLTSAVAKIEKVTAQRSTFQRQRDEAGARLRAAGAEFATLTSKLEELSIAKNTVQNHLVQTRDERDAALSRVEEMMALESQLKLTQDSLDSKTKEVEDVQSKLKESRQEVTTMQESIATAQQKVSSLTTELSELQGRLEVVSRDKDLTNKQKEDLEHDKTVLQQKVSERESCEAQLSKQLRSLETDYTTLKEKSAMDLGIAKAELASEQERHQELKVKLSDLQTELSQYTSAVDQIRSAVASCVEAIQSNLVERPEAMCSVEWQCIEDVLTSEETQAGVSAAKLVSKYGEVTTQLIRDTLNIAKEYNTVQAKYDDSAKLLVTLEQDKAELLVGASEVETLRIEMGEARRDLEAVYTEKALMETEIGNLQEQLTAAATQRAELEARLEALAHEMQEEMQRGIQLSAEERDRLLHETEKFTSNLNSIWSMLRKSLGQEQLEVLTDEASQYGETEENVPVLALRATASIVAEVSRNRSHIEDIESKLVTAEAEAARLIDRAEIAEQERDSAKGTNERLERKLKVSHAEGKEEAKAHYEGVIGQLEDELECTREELSRVSDKANRSEKETGELRALCSKLTSQFNGRTNELDEAEEKVVYLQDQVTTLEEDLEEAHARLKKLEEESTEARQSDIKRLTDKLEETTAQLEQIEKECIRLREAHDEAESIAKESKLLAETHRQAEENLQIAIEQLEAAQESAVEQRTIELQKKLENAEQRCNAATEREAASAVTQKQLSIRDEEIKELRGAIGRLADERVELKLELEKSLSRLNHPDAGGQLVDRRVVRQLLVSYFRVGSVRRRDVLELMSRMLAFSDADNIAVGLKRRALIDRLGSLVQAPELDDASLPPLGTVSDKWIEFLMKETEEGEEQAKGW